MKKQKGFGILGIVLAIVIVGAVCFSGWYVWYQSQKNDHMQTVNNSEPDTEVTIHNMKEQETTEAGEDIPKGWKLYENNEIGLSFYYPDGWKVDEPFGNVDPGVVAILHTPNIKQVSEKSEIRGAQYDYYIELAIWGSINEEGAKGGSSLGTDNSYNSLDEYLHDPMALKKFISKIAIKNGQASEVEISDVSGYYGVMMEVDGKILQLGFPTVFASQGPDQTVKELINSIRLL